MACLAASLILALIGLSYIHCYPLAAENAEALNGDYRHDTVRRAADPPPSGGAKDNYKFGFGFPPFGMGGGIGMGMGVGGGYGFPGYGGGFGAGMGGGFGGSSFGGGFGSGMGYGFGRR